MDIGRTVEIRSRDYWCKVVDGPLPIYHWGLIDEDTNGAGCTVFFFSNLGSVFDRLRLASVIEAEIALLRNGFKRYDTDKQAQEFIRKPEPPFRARQTDYYQPIYSAGTHWK